MTTSLNIFQVTYSFCKEFLQVLMSNVSPGKVGFNKPLFLHVLHFICEKLTENVIVLSSNNCSIAFTTSKKTYFGGKRTKHSDHYLFFVWIMFEFTAIQNRHVHFGSFANWKVLVTDKKS